MSELIKAKVTGVPSAKYVVRKDNKELVAVIISNRAPWLPFVAILLLAIGVGAFIYYYFVQEWSIKDMVSTFFSGIATFLDEDIDSDVGFAFLMLILLVGVGMFVYLLFRNDMFVFDLRDWKFKWFKIYPWGVSKKWEEELSKLSRARLEIVEKLIASGEDDDIYIYVLTMHLPPEVADSFPGKKLKLDLCSSRDDEDLNDFLEVLREVLIKAGSKGKVTQEEG